MESSGAAEFLQPAFGFGKVGPQLESFLVVGYCRLLHSFGFALLAQQIVLGSECLQEAGLLSLLLFQVADLSLELVYLVQLAADKSLGRRLLDIVAAVDGSEKVVQEAVHVALVVCLCRHYRK